MILGMSTSAFTMLHVLISLIAILTGLVVAVGMTAAKRLDGLTAVFLATTVLTSVTGFFFHTDKVLPSHIVGALSLVVLAVALAALYLFRLAGAWRWLYVAGAMVALYLNVFVLVVQSFLKVPFLHALAPKGNEPPFAIVQGLVLLLFVGLSIVAVRRFHPEARPLSMAGVAAAPPAL
jgi:hypothetical protein